MRRPDKNSLYKAENHETASVFHAGNKTGLTIMGDGHGMFELPADGDRSVTAGIWESASAKKEEWGGDSVGGVLADAGEK